MAYCDAVFFFSSRRRHTRFDCDWSSDVCSSDLIPVGLPPGTRVAHKTGWIGEVVYHDAAVVYRSSGGSYVLVVLTGGIKQDSVAHNLVADLSRLVYGADSP